MEEETYSIVDANWAKSTKAHVLFNIYSYFKILNQLIHYLSLFIDLLFFILRNKFKIDEK